MFLIFLLFLNNCSSWNSAKKNGCLSVHANYYELETLHFANKTRNYPNQSPKLLYNPFKSIVFKNLTYEERCEHTKTLVKATSINTANANQRWLSLLKLCKTIQKMAIACSKKALIKAR